MCQVKYFLPPRLNIITISYCHSESWGGYESFQARKHTSCADCTN
uniref:Uncharacterized protein n=1 Tax=Anguilla anguilla TaxID=7936 RepID=A0A0E9QP86_ANGAN